MRPDDEIGNLVMATDLVDGWLKVYSRCVSAAPLVLPEFTSVMTLFLVMCRERPLKIGVLLLLQ